MLLPEHLRDLLWKNSFEESALLCGVCCLCACMCVCVTCTYRFVDMHPSTRTYIYSFKRFMFMKVWNIVVCNQKNLDPNKPEQAHDVVRERQLRF